MPKLPIPDEERVTVNAKAVYDRAREGLSIEETAAELGVSTKKVKVYQAAYDRGYCQFLAELKRLQLQQARTAKGTALTTALIWLGKVHLGQSETQTLHVKTDPNMELAKEMEEAFGTKQPKLHKLKHPA